VLVANVLLLERGGLYAVALVGQAIFYALVLAGGLADRVGRSLGRLAVPYYFCVVAAAQMTGLVRFLRGGAQAVWSPTSGTGDRARGVSLRRALVRNTAWYGAVTWSALSPL
jgi:hypothetical protein